MNNEAKHLSYLVHLVAENTAGIEAYEELAKVLGGKLEAKGLFFIRYVVAAAGKQQRIEGFSGLRPWFIENVIPHVQAIIEALENGTAAPSLEDIIEENARSANSTSAAREEDSKNQTQEEKSRAEPESRSARGFRWAKYGVFLLIVIPYTFKLLFTGNLIFGDLNRAASFIVQVIFGSIIVAAIAYVIGWATGSSKSTLGSVPDTSAPPIQRSEADAKECPYCAETIKARAIKCRYCGSNLSQGKT